MAKRRIRTTGINLTQAGLILGRHSGVIRRRYPIRQRRKRGKQ